MSNGYWVDYSNPAVSLPTAQERRDYARAALIGLLMRGDIRNPEALAAKAFEQADAMIQQEQKQP